MYWGSARRLLLAVLCVVVLLGHAAADQPKRSRKKKKQAAGGGPPDGSGYSGYLLPTDAAAGACAMSEFSSKSLEELVAKGNTYFTEGKWGEALTCYDNAANHDRMHAVALSNIGLVNAGRGNYRHALHVCTDLDKRQIDHSNVAYCRGMGALGVKEHATAVEQLEKAQKAGAAAHVEGALAQAYEGLSSERSQQGRHEEARRAALRATQLAPASGTAFKQLGVALNHLGSMQEGVKAFQTAVQLNPKDAEAFANLGLTAGHLGMGKESVEALERAIELHPTFLQAHVALGKQLHGLHRTHRAIQVFERARNISETPEIISGLMMAATDLCDWHRKSQLEPAILEHARAQLAAPVLKRTTLVPFDSLLVVRTPPLLVRRIAERYMQVARAEVQAIHGGEVGGGAGAPVRRGEALRVAYFSSDFGDQPVGRLVAALPRHHHLARVSPHMFALNPDDRSAYRRHFAHHCASSTALVGTSNEGAVKQMRAGGMHVLVDLMGFTAAGYAMPREHIVALKPAPLTLAMVGYPGTVGGVSDAAQGYYSLVDRVAVTPQMAAHFSEALLYMPHSYQVNSMAVVEAQLKGQGRVLRRDHGLPPHAFVFAHFNTLRKIDEMVFRVWMSILHRSPGSVLWLLAMPSGGVAHLKKQALAQGVAVDRLVFGKPVTAEQQLQRCALADLFLDSLHYNAHTTATDTLRAAVPILTLPGGMMQSRVAAGLVEAAEVPELVVQDLKEYEDRAVRLSLSR